MNFNEDILCPVCKKPNKVFVEGVCCKCAKKISDTWRSIEK